MSVFNGSGLTGRPRSAIAFTYASGCQWQWQSTAPGRVAAPCAKPRFAAITATPAPAAEAMNLRRLTADRTSRSSRSFIIVLLSGPMPRGIVPLQLQQPHRIAPENQLALRRRQVQFLDERIWFRDVHRRE